MNTKQDQKVLVEAKYLHDLGWAVHWLMPKEKRPIESGWATGPRKTWEELEVSFKPEYNLGVRTGKASKIDKNYLACIDVDIHDAKFKAVAVARLKQLIGDAQCIGVRSGSGNGSRHLYCVTSESFKMRTIEKHKGEWEICVYSDGRQMVLPPSIHPSGAEYKWVGDITRALPLLSFECVEREPKKEKLKKSPTQVETAQDFNPVYVDLRNSKLRKSVIAKIEKCDGVTDRSAEMLGIAMSMLNAKMNDQEIVSVLTDPKNKISEAAVDRRGSNRMQQADWVSKYVLEPAKKMLTPVFTSIPSNSQQVADGSRPSIERKLQLKFEFFNEITIDTSMSALVEDLIDHQSSVLVFGDTNTGKTFAALDLAAHVAQGKEWQGRKVERGAVLYVAAEGGGNAIKKRIVAIRQTHNLENELIPFRLAHGTIDLRDPVSDTPVLIDEIKETEKLFGIPVKLVVIDTLSRALSGGDENDSADMSGFVKSIDCIRNETKATVLIVHHQGKDKSKGARGHSLLKCAVDTEIEVETIKDSDLKRLKTTKQRDYDYALPIGFKLKSVEITKSDSGKAITSCVVESVNLDTIKAFVEKPKGVALKAFQILEAHSELSFVDISQEEWRKRFLDQYYKGKNRKTQSSAFLNAQKELSSSGHIEIRGEHVRILEKRE